MLSTIVHGLIGGEAQYAEQTKIKGSQAFPTIKIIDQFWRTGHKKGNNTRNRPKMGRLTPRPITPLPLPPINPYKTVA